MIRPRPPPFYIMFHLIQRKECFLFMPPLLVDSFYDLFMTDFISLEDIEDSLNSNPSSEDMEFWNNLLGGLYEKSCAYHSIC